MWYRRVSGELAEVQEEALPAILVYYVWSMEDFRLKYRQAMLSCLLKGL